MATITAAGPDEYERLLREALACAMPNCMNDAVRCNKCADCLQKFGCAVCGEALCLECGIVYDGAGLFCPPCATLNAPTIVSMGLPQW